MLFHRWKFICRCYCKYKSYISNHIHLVKEDLNSNWLFFFRLCCSFMFLHSLKCLYSCASVGSEHQCITIRNQVYILVWIANVCLKQCKRLKNSSDWKYAFLFLHCDTVFLYLRGFCFLSDVEQLKKELDELVNALEKHFFQPEKNNLQRKTE